MPKEIVDISEIVFTTHSVKANGALIARLPWRCLMHRVM